MLAVEEVLPVEVLSSSTTSSLDLEDETTQINSLFSQKHNEYWPTGCLASNALMNDFYVEDSVESEDLLLAPLAINAAGFDIPHPEKAYKGGEDAYFIHVGESHTVLGVADGVSGWASVGVDPGLFSTAFMDYAKSLAEQGETDPAVILREAYLHGVVGHVVGSSTACIVSIDHSTRRLQAVNVGDSGFLVVRDGYAAYKSSEQQHYFNAPFQLTSLVGESLDFSHMKPHVFSSTPEEADYYEFDLEEGDRIMLATDGVFDNTHLDYLCRVMNSDASPQELCEFICEQTFAFSQDSQHLSPFATGARAAGYPSCLGGKPDDITVVVAEITEQ